MIWDILITLCLISGAAFILVGAIGLIKLDTPMKRLHAPTKASTLGVGSLLLASVLHAFVYEDGSLHELLITAFLFATAPISANLIAKVNLHHKKLDPAPPKPGDQIWATFDVEASDLAAPQKAD